MLLSTDNSILTVLLPIGKHLILKLCIFKTLNKCNMVGYFLYIDLDSCEYKLLLVKYLLCHLFYVPLINN